LEKDAKIYVAGAQTLIGSALVHELQSRGYARLVGSPGEEPDLTDAGQVDAFFTWARPEYVFLTAGMSGGIEANQKYPADLILDNLLTECHVIHNAYRHGVKKLLYLASSCSYPRQCPQPMQEKELLGGPLEPTNEAYAVAKIAGIKLCESYRKQYGADFICAIPANPFGRTDDFESDDSHVIPALLRKMHQAKMGGAPSVEIWGTGSARREFIFADDVADACLLLMDGYEDLQPINLGTGIALSIKELAELMKEVVGFKGQLSFDTTKPDGMPVKVLDSSKLLGMGWRPRTDFKSSLEATYQSFLEKKNADR
jgi:GDP-L-fucose synthase